MIDSIQGQIQVLEQEKINNTYKRNFYDAGFKSVFIPMATMCELGKEVFSRTIGLHFICAYLRNKGPGQWTYSISLPTAGIRMGLYREPMIGGRSIPVPEFYVGTNEYKGGGFSAPFSVWNYLMRNLGKVVGLLATSPLLIVTVPYAAIKAAYSYNQVQNGLTKRILMLSEQIENTNQSDLNASPRTLHATLQVQNKADGHMEDQSTIGDNHSHHSLFNSTCGEDYKRLDAKGDDHDSDSELRKHN